MFTWMLTLFETCTTVLVFLLRIYHNFFVLDSFMFPGWKKKFCQLKADGLFTIGDGKHVDHHFNTKIDLKKVEQGFEAESLNLPKGRADMESMFVVHAKHKKYYLLAGNSGEC